MLFDAVLDALSDAYGEKSENLAVLGHCLSKKPFFWRLSSFLSLQKPEVINGP